ncbi:hypothetical protein ACPWT1_08850 [Ramlibacter sp. MMS24-I3-19]|uniref:hypothetical protein n=1 Tax=Ramlibacter sp. MMS24-I3-19 TaxID=3416606 RepID=UPI003CFC3961
MLSRLFDPDGTPRNPALWLVMAGVAASLLLAFFVVCVHQVERAQTRHVEESAQARQLAGPQVATQDCARSATGLIRCDAALQADSRLR